jgi:hypothetical protein
MREKWNGIMKITEISHVRGGEIIWSDGGLYNILHSEGENFILQSLFHNDGTFPPEYYYLGLDSRVSVSYSDAMIDIVDEPVASGYSRQTLKSSSVGGGWSISTGAGLHKAVSNIVSFNATGSYGPVRNLFLTTESDDSGFLVSSVALSAPATLSPGDVLNLRMTLSLRDCP